MNVFLNGVQIRFLTKLNILLLNKGSVYFTAKIEDAGGNR